MKYHLRSVYSNLKYSTFLQFYKDTDLSSVVLSGSSTTDSDFSGESTCLLCVLKCSTIAIRIKNPPRANIVYCRDVPIFIGFTEASYNDLAVSSSSCNNHHIQKNLVYIITFIVSFDQKIGQTTASSFLTSLIKLQTR